MKDIKKQEERLKQVFESNISKIVDQIDRATTEIEKKQGQILALQNDIAILNKEITSNIEEKAKLLTEYNEFVETLD